MKRFFTHRRRREEPSFVPSDPLTALDWVVFPPEPGVPPSGAPPVRIFLGTEPAHYRAERVFVWSVLKHRDPSRRYEIALMKHLPGFSRKNWTTGFTNYRFAIPSLAGCEGRAIYNDTDQIYCADPAVLFDAEMGGAGYLAASPDDTSVMLLDCAAMAAVWSLESAQREAKRELNARAAAAAGLYGALDAKWNARDEEYVEGHSCVLHFTALHLQPWRPEPEHYSYRQHPHGELWSALERGADEAGFTLFNREQPSGRFQRLVSGSAELHDRAPVVERKDTANFPGKVLSRHLGAIGELITQTQAQSILDYGAGKATLYQTPAGRAPTDPSKVMPSWGDKVRVTVYDPGYQPYANLPDARFGGVVSTDVLEHISEEDIPWVLQEIFSRAESFVYVSVACYPAKKSLATGENAHVCIKSPDWWEDQFRSAARRFPDVFWTLSIRIRNWRRRKVQLIRRGGRWPRSPRVWVLADDRPGNRNQAIAMAEALGHEYVIKTLRYGTISALHNAVLGASRRGLTRGAAEALASPWPDVVVAAGRRTAPVARWIKKQSAGAARLILLGRKGSADLNQVDAAVTPAHCRLPGHPNRVETLIPFSPMALTPQTTDAAKGQPLTVVLVGGPTRRHRFADADVAELIAAIRQDQKAFPEGQLCILTTARTGTRATAQMRGAFEGDAQLLTPQEIGDMYWSKIRAASRLIITGDSESLVADAVASGRSVFIHPLPVVPLTSMQRLGAWLERRAEHRPNNRRHTTRPQRKLEYLCARLFERGWLLPLRDMEMLHEALFSRALAAPLGGPVTVAAESAGHSAAQEELVRTLSRVRELIAVRVPSGTT